MARFWFDMVIDCGVVAYGLAAWRYPAMRKDSSLAVIVVLLGLTVLFHDMLKVRVS